MKTVTSTLVLASLWALLFVQPTLAAAEFTGVGQLNDSGSQLNAVSDNGQTVVGSVLVNGVQKASRWSAAEGFVLLGDLALGESLANAVSSDGQAIVGQAFNGSEMEAFRWTAGTGMVGLGALSSRGSAALDVSDDGNTVVGIDGGPAEGCGGFNCTIVPGTQQAFAWRSGRGMEYLPRLAGESLTEAFAVSGDGSIIVGRSFRYLTQQLSGPGIPLFLPVPRGFPTFWNINNNVSQIANLNPNPGSSAAIKITANDEVLISGVFDLFFGPLAGEKPLLPVELNFRTISTDGATIAGSSPVTMTAALQHIGQYVDLKPLLMAHFDLDLTGWILQEVTGLSANGLTIVGTGLNPQGLEEGWVARLDAWPSAAELAAVPRVNGFETSSPLASAVLPASRSAQVGEVVTAFVTVLNTEANLDSFGCRMALKGDIPATFDYHQTDPVTNAAVGDQNVPADIAAAGSQTFVIGLTPSAPFDPTDVELIYDCANSTPTRSLVGVNTLSLSASIDPVADVVALITTTDLAIPIGGSASAAVAVANVGSSAEITVRLDTAGVALPLEMLVCPTNPSTGECLETSSEQTGLTLTANATASFMVTLNASDYIDFNPANNRVFVRFVDENGVLRGATSLSVRTPE